MADDPVLRAIERDEALRVVQVLSDKPAGRTELVEDGAGQRFIRKRIPAELANREAWAALAQVKHARLPRVIGSYELPDCFVVVCSYVEGESLAGMMEREGRLDAPWAAEIAAEVADAAAVLHAVGVIHRDISPTNVIIAEDGAHLIDLGIARAYDEDASHDTTRLGTWGFAAPEQYGFAQTDARSDVYSIGRLLGWMLTGVRPDDEAFEPALADEGLVPLPLRRVIERACAFEPSSRYPNCTDLANALRAGIDGLIVEVNIVDVPPADVVGLPRGARLRDMPWGPAKIGVILAIAVLGFLAVMLVIGGTFAYVQPTRPGGFFSMILGFFWSAGSIAAALSIYNAYLGHKAFRNREDRLPLLARQLVLIVVACLAALFVLTVIYALLFPNS